MANPPGLVFPSRLMQSRSDSRNIQWFHAVASPASTIRVFCLRPVKGQGWRGAKLGRRNRDCRRMSIEFGL